MFKISILQPLEIIAQTYAEFVRRRILAPRVPYGIRSRAQRRLCFEISQINVIVTDVQHQVLRQIKRGAAARVPNEIIFVPPLQQRFADNDVRRFVSADADAAPDVKRKNVESQNVPITVQRHRNRRNPPFGRAAPKINLPHAGHIETAAGNRKFRPKRLAEPIPEPRPQNVIRVETAFGRRVTRIEARVKPFVRKRGETKKPAYESKQQSFHVHSRFPLSVRRNGSAG